MRKSIVVNPQKYPFNAIMAVLDDMVMIFVTEGSPFAILIKNKHIASTLWSIHSMFWDRYED